MHLFIYGPPGSGKSTIGKLLAEALNMPFLDLDVEIENAAGKSISEFMAEKGEAAFREMESRALQTSVAGIQKVIALGGGALLRDGNFALAQSKGQVIFLEVEPSILSERLKRMPTFVLYWLVTLKHPLSCF